MQLQISTPYSVLIFLKTYINIEIITLNNIEDIKYDFIMLYPDLCENKLN